MAKARPDDIATEDINRVVLYDGDHVLRQLEAANVTYTEPDGTIRALHTERLIVLRNGQILELGMQGLRIRDDIGVCRQCRKPLIPLGRRQRQSDGIRPLDTLRFCADCGELRCPDHRLSSLADSAQEVYRCYLCAIRHPLRELRRRILFERR